MLMMEEQLNFSCNRKRLLYFELNFFGKDMSKKRGKITNRIKVLPLDIFKELIENAYTSKKADEGDDDN